MQNTSENNSNTPQKGMVTSLHENAMSKELWTYARNAKMNSHLGQMQFIQNEPSNYKCVDLPYTPIGFTRILNNKWIVFSTDDANSEIGIFDESECKYSKIINDTCLNFKKDYLIKSTSKEMFDCSETIYWTDAFNPRRKLNLSKIPYKYTILDDTCETKEYTKKLDCDAILIDSTVNIPLINSRVSSSGSLKNGVYQFAIAYAFNNERVTEYYSTSRPQSIWSHENYGQSISLEISNLDRDYDQYQLVVIATTDGGVTNYGSLGFYSTANSHIQVSSLNKIEPLTLEEIIIPRPRYPYADNLVSNDQYLLWSGVKTTAQLNYQPQAMKIASKYIVYQAPSDYYAKGGQLKGYIRDEVYSFGIQWLDKFGSWSVVYHIPGLKDEAEAKRLASGKDVYETLDDDNEEVIYNWQVNNTAGDAIKLNSNSKSSEKVIAEGKMAYWQSSRLYPDNIIYGEDKCTPIRHHKFPDNAKTHHYQKGGQNINILGVRFENIEHPKDYSGKYDESIVGYRIVRGDRNGNRSVIAKGFCTNVRSYKENDQEILYPNYPYNDLRADGFLSYKQTQHKNSEQNYSALTEYKKDQFNFYSPNTLFNNTSLGDEINFLTEEYAETKGFFEHVYKHPKQKLVTQFDMYFALIIGALDGYYALTGQRGKSVSITANHTISLGSIQTPSGPTPPQTIIQNSTKTQTAINDALAFTNTTSVDKKSLDFGARVLQTLAKVGVFAYFAVSTAQKVLDIIAQANPWQEYDLQYNSYGNFNEFKSIQKDNRRRHIEHYQYLYDGLNTIEEVQFNNYKRENSVYLRLSSEIKEPSRIDKSRNTVGELNLCNDFKTSVISNASIYYAQVKRKIPNQYGQIDGVRYIDTGDGVQSITSQVQPIGSTEKFYTSSPIFGGDVFINQFAIKRTHNYFSQSLYDVPDGYIYDYRTFRNVAYPRYWMDSTPYDLSGLVSKNPSTSKTPRNAHNLDCQGNDGSNAITVVQNRWFYLANSGVINAFVESELNLDYRDWKNERPNFYSRYNQNLSQLFRSDRITEKEEYVLDESYSKELYEIYAPTQQTTFNPLVEESCYTYLKNRIIYSQPAFKDQKADGWLTYLINNKYDFPMAEFGQLTSMQAVDNQQIVFLFDKASPYITIGRDELQLDGSGRKITLGDGGLFARPPRPISFTDTHYGNCQSKWAFNNTPFGLFYPSQRQGSVFLMQGEKLVDITENGMDHWFNNYLPSNILRDFPDYNLKDNPINGIGLTSMFDGTDKTYYLSKKDYTVQPKYKNKLLYNADKNKFYYGNIEAKLTDTEYFEDASWTISYDPRQQIFISYHDWHPDFMLQTENHFMSVKNNAIWKHNEEYTSFCNFYGKDYSFELEYVINNGPNTEVLRSLEYQLDAGKYFSDGRGFHQILNENFDYLILHNNEQISGNLHLNLQDNRNLSQRFTYPYIDLPNNKIEILFSKEEQKYRVNQFWDITKDRGEFDGKNLPLWIYASNGVDKYINDKAVDYNKTMLHRKKFRSVWHKILMKKLKCNDKKLIFKFNNAKEVNSPR